MQDSDTSVAQLKEIVKKYCEERDWDQYHNPKELAIGVITEAAELLEPFRYKSEKQMDDMLKDPEKLEKMSEEMIDVLFNILRMAQLYEIDITTAFHKKMEQNRKKYPIERARGSNKKYDVL